MCRRSNRNFSLVTRAQPRSAAEAAVKCSLWLVEPALRLLYCTKPRGGSALSLSLIKSRQHKACVAMYI